MHKHLIIIGNSIATDALLEQLGCEHAFAITVLSAEAVPFYNRIMLSPVLGKEMSLEDASPRCEQWYSERNATVLLNHAVTAIDTSEQKLQCANGKNYHYDLLIIATGSSSAMPPVSGIDFSNVIGFRDLHDVDFMQQLCTEKKSPTTVVIGGGLLGVEAACGLKLLGANSVLMHRRDILMNRQLDKQGSALLQQSLAERGVEVLTPCNPTAICGSANKANILHYEQAGLVKQLAVDLVVFATGISPATALAQAAGIHCNKGIIVNEQLQTSANNVYAIGECSEFSDNTFGLVAPIKDQASVLAKTLLKKPASYAEKSYMTCLKVSGLSIHSMGIIDDQQSDVIELLDETAGIYKKLLLENNKLIGALLIGDTAASQTYFQLYEQQIDISEQRHKLIFKPELTCNSESTIAKVA